MIKRFFATASLNTKTLAVIVFGVVLAVGVFFATTALGNSLIENIYMSPNKVAARKARIYTSFAVYVRQNGISGTDATAINSWTASQDYVTIVVIGRNGSANFSSRGGHESNVSNQVSSLVQAAGIFGKLYPMQFADGDYQIAIGDTSQNREQMVFTFWALLLSVLSFLVLMFVYIQQVTLRIVTLSHEAAEIGRGDLQAPITSTGGDELSRLAAEVDHMRHSVIERMDKERKAWEANSELITAISHDIRTPMTSLIGYLVLLNEDDMRNTDKDRIFAQSAYGKAMELKVLTDELFKYFLVFGRAELDLKNDEYDAHLLLEQLVGEASFDLSDAGFTISSSEFEGDCRIVTDPMYLKRVMDNLVSNAKKYADKNYPIFFASSLHGKKLTLRVSNTIGRSIERVESTRIGLRTCEKILSAMHGTFTTENDGETFTAQLQLPVQRNEKR